MRIRRLSLLVALFTTLVPAAISQTLVSVTYDYAAISFPGAPVTNVNGINNSNVIVGSYYDSQYFVHGFIYRAGKYTAINFPGATVTEVLGINDNGDIVGMYQLPGGLNFHGFVRHNGSFTRIDDPSAEFGTMAFGINKFGTIVGSFDNAQGFVYQNGTYRTLNAPQLPGEPYQTQLNGINDQGWIVGQVFRGGIWRGFWIANNQLHFVEPAGSTDSEATGINDRGDIAGCHDIQAGFVSFAVGNYASAGKFPPEQRVVSCASGINYARAIVGSYSTLNHQNGFLGIPALTLQVSLTWPSANLVHIAATASGNNPIAQIQVWLNGSEVYHVAGGTLNANIKLPAGTNEKLIVRAIDSKGVSTKVTDTITVN